MQTTNNAVRSTILRQLQNWATAFETKPHLASSEMVQLYRSLKSQGLPFPYKDPSATAAMIDSMAVGFPFRSIRETGSYSDLQAPEWRDSDLCSRCRDAFTFVNRKHHCRNCGEIFDQKCSSKVIPLPHYGITGPVRVCDGCYTKLMKKYPNARR
jgi:hepatocyte growth factor-regulated tyrosine kinase substrate